jgi:quinol monooxygenase YgiN
MTTRVQWLFELSINDGDVQNVRALMEEMSRATEQNEPGTLNYEWFLTDDGTACQIFERFADSAAAMTHLGNFQEKFAERFLALLQPTRLTVHGGPSDDLREAMGALGAQFLADLGGFSR